MTSMDSKAKAGELSAESVVDYLRRHPRFLTDKPELLRELSIPHQTPTGVSSLIERQVSDLRQENQRYQQQLASLGEYQRALEALTEKAHRLTLDILQSDHITGICDRWHDFLRKDYGADAAVLFLFLDHNPFPASDLLRVRSRHDKLRLLLVELFNRNRPLIDSLQAELMPLMFDQAAGGINSTVLMPMIGRDWNGLLALGSQQRDHYRRDQAFELLVFLTRVTTLRLEQWLQADSLD